LVLHASDPAARFTNLKPKVVSPLFPMLSDLCIGLAGPTLDPSATGNLPFTTAKIREDGRLGTYTLIT